MLISIQSMGDRSLTGVLVPVAGIGSVPDNLGRMPRPHCMMACRDA
jgi:hypothetical protein